MSGFSTIVDGTTVSPLRLNYDVTTSASGSYTALLTAKGITDRNGLQVIVYNSAASAIDITLPISNYLGYPGYATSSLMLIPPGQSVTFITKSVGSSYTISAISAQTNINKGAAGDLIYQTAANTTGYLAAGTPGYVLESGGPGAPPYWNVLSTGNLSGGVAGSLVWQSATNTTSKSAVGTALTSTGGSFASMTSGTTSGWNTTKLLGSYNGSSVYSGSTLTLNSCKAYTFNTVNIGGSSGNLYTYMNSIGLPQYDGDVYVLYNNTASNYVLTIQNIENPNGWSNTFITSFAGGANQITLYPNETVVFQRYNATYLTIMSTTQSQNTVGVFNFGVISPTTTTVNILPYSSTVYNPGNWTTTSTRIIPNTAGNYRIYAQITNNSAGRYFNLNTNNSRLILLQKNGVAIGNVQLQATDTNSYTITNTIFSGTYMNGSTDYLEVYGFTGAANFVSASMTLALIT